MERDGVRPLPGRFVRMRVLVGSADAVDLGRSPLHRHVRTHSSHHLQKMQIVAYLHGRRHLREQRHPDIDGTARKRERPGHDGDHPIVLIIQTEGAADQIGRAAELTLPQVVADCRHARRSEAVFVRAKRPAQHR